MLVALLGMLQVFLVSLLVILSNSIISGLENKTT